MVATHTSWHVKLLPQMGRTLFMTMPAQTVHMPTLSLENHQDGVYLHRHGVTLSLQAILVCSNLPV